MYRYEIAPSLQKELIVLSRRDPVLYEAAVKKMAQIARCENPHHYKNLRHNMKEHKRAHVKRHFVILFRVDDAERLIFFECLDHHGNVYLR